MRSEQEAMMFVRAELCERLRSLQSHSGKQSGRQFTESVAGMRRLAAAYGLTPVVRLAEALERAFQEQPGGTCPTALYVDRLQDAIGCQRLDDAASETMIASISVRLS